MEIDNCGEFGGDREVIGDRGEFVKLVGDRGDRGDFKD